FSALDSQSGLLFQNLRDTNEVAAIDVGKRSVDGQWPLAPCVGPSGMAIDAEQRRLFAVCSGNAKLVVFDLESHRVITSLSFRADRPAKPHENVLALRWQQPGAARSRTHWRNRSRVAVRSGACVLERISGALALPCGSGDSPRPFLR